MVEEHKACQSVSSTVWNVYERNLAQVTLQAYTLAWLQGDFFQDRRFGKIYTDWTDCWRLLNVVGNGVVW